MTVPVRFGSRGHLADWSPVEPPGGWTYATAKAAALQWAAQNYTAHGVRLEPLAAAALAALATAVDGARGLTPSSSRSLRRAALDARLSGRDL